MFASIMTLCAAESVCIVRVVVCRDASASKRTVCISDLGQQVASGWFDFLQECVFLLRIAGLLHEHGCDSLGMKSKLQIHILFRCSLQIVTVLIVSTGFSVLITYSIV